MTTLDDQRMPRARLRRWLVVVSVTVVMLLMIGAAIVALGELVGRPVIAGIIADELEQALPGTPVEVEVAGIDPIVVQLARGSLDEVEVHSPALPVCDASVEASVVLHGVPLDRAQPVRWARGVFVIDETALNTLIVPNATSSAITIDAGEFRYERELNVFGVRKTVAVRFAPELRGDELAFVPFAVDADASDAPAIGLERIDLTLFAFSFCVAELLPEAVTITGITTEPGRVLVSATAHDLALDAASLSRTGNCA